MMNTLFERIHHIDTRAFLWVNVKYGCEYKKLIRFISWTGDGPLYAVLALCILYLEKEMGLLFFIAALIGYAIDVCSYLLLKNLIKRDRPQQKLAGFHALITPSDQFSFPSGHTAAAFVFATLVFHFIPLYAVGIFLWASLIGLSRVLLGVHFPGDILAGALLGFLSAFCGILIGQTYFYH